MTPDERRLLERVDARLDRLERLILAAIDAAPFWLRAKLKGAVNGTEGRRQRDTADTTGTAERRSA